MLSTRILNIFRLPRRSYSRLCDIEGKWRRIGEDNPPKPDVIARHPEQYILAMFPYPSGALHMGHVRVYSISDCIARFERLRRYKRPGSGASSSESGAVLHPIGWDAFGLPAENAALARNCQPADWTHSNINQMRQQLINLGISLDWNHEISTCDPKYYRWTQWLFARMYERGLAYRADALVSWDPVDGTVLAAEQVDSQGRSWRSGALVQRRSLTQWYFKVTAYADDLLAGLDALNWPESVKEMQRNWIGRAEGAIIKFPLVGSSENNCSLSIYTTRSDTLPLVRFLAVHPNHPLAANATNQAASGLQARNPLTGERIPIWVADYVREDVGEGAVMGVPSHDERDAKFYQEKMSLAIKPSTSSLLTEWQTKDLFDRGIATKTIRYKMRDWLISRQRAWGTPIPVVYCPEHGAQVVDDVKSAAFVELPSKISYQKAKDFHDEAATIASPLANDLIFLNSGKCPKCQGPARRETDTMDTFVDSSWYFLRFLDPLNSQQPFNPALLAAKLSSHEPVVDWYVGGIEHAILHLLYARFITKVFAEMMLEGDGKATAVAARQLEPFKRLLTQGLVQGKTHRCAETGRYLRPDEIASASVATSVSWEKMSKSKFNGVEPSGLIERYGSDCVRLAVLFKAPPSVSLNWDDRDMVGQERFLMRLLKLYEAEAAREAEADHEAKRQHTMSSATQQPAVLIEAAEVINSCIIQITENFDKGPEPSFNVHIALLMKTANHLHSLADKLPPSSSFKWICFSKFAAILKAYAPFTAQELAEICRRQLKQAESNDLEKGCQEVHSSSLQLISIPTAATSSLPSPVELPVFLDGKPIGKVTVQRPTMEDNLETLNFLERTARTAYPQQLATASRFIWAREAKRQLLNFVTAKK